MAINHDGLPKELKEFTQWCLWKLETVPGKERPTKIPYQINGKKASSIDKTTWSSYQAICDVIAQNNTYNGIGFFLSEDDPYCFIDLDNCIEDGNINQWALEILKEFNSYSEFSQSLLGIHIIIKGSLNGLTNHRKGNYEVYDNKRYCAMTGYQILGYTNDIQSRQDELLKIHRRIFSPTNGKKPTTKYARQNPKSDEEIIASIQKARNASKFDRLMGGKWEGEYPSQSEADSALSWLVAFYTHDVDQIDSIMRKSKLSREKWDTNKSYLPRTIENAIEKVPLFEGFSVHQKRLKTEDIEVGLNDSVSDDKKVEFFKCTDYGNAERLVYYYGDNLLYCCQYKKWYIWDNTRWKQDNNLAIVRLAKNIVRKIYIEAGNTEDDKIRKDIDNHARKSEGNIRIQAMISLAQSEKSIAIESHQLDSNLWMLNCLNGTLDLKKGELLPHKRENLITKIIPVGYDPDAKLKKWDDFLNTATKQDKELQSFIQRAVGYSLTGDVSEEKLFFISGPAGSGKSTFIEAIKSILSEYARTADFESFVSHTFAGGARNDIASLVDARFVSSIEIDEGKRLAEGLVKLITGGDTVTARFLYQESFSFIPQFKLWLVANDKPLINPDDDGMWRRIVPINFDHVIPEEERDPVVKATLKDPAIAGPAILAWAVRGCLDWQKEGLKITESIKISRSEYKDEMDWLKQYVNEYCQIEEATVISKQMLYSQYRQWCKNSGINCVSKIIFAKKLKKSFPTIKEDVIGHDNERVWLGIRINTYLTDTSYMKDDDLFSHC